MERVEPRQGIWEKGRALEDGPDNMPQAGPTKLTSCEMEEKRLQTSTKERSSELQEKGDGKNATWSGKESAKRQKCIKWFTASINIGGTRIVGGTWEQRSMTAEDHRRHQARGVRHGGKRPLWVIATKGAAALGRATLGKHLEPKWLRELLLSCLLPCVFSIDFWRLTGSMLLLCAQTQWLYRQTAWLPI